MKTPPPDPRTLTAFSQLTQQEIERNRFAATTGALVTLSSAAFWELYYAAIAWHEHLKAHAQGGAVEAYLEHGKELRAFVDDMVRAGVVVDERNPDQQSATAT